MFKQKQGKRCNKLGDITMKSYGIKTMFGLGVLVLCIAFSGNNTYAATEISTDTEITSNDTTGIRVTADCTITFSGGNDITVGDANNACPGIEISDGVTLTLVNNITDDATLNIYGGRQERTNESINYAGIYVPGNATLNMQGLGTTYVYGNGQTYGSGAGIGGNGITTTTSSANTLQSNTGTINISNGTVYSYGGGKTAPGEIRGTGAGIGSGAIWNSQLTSVIAGSVYNINITGGNVYAYGGGSINGWTTGSGAGIGSGGIYNGYNNTSTISGGTITLISITTTGVVVAQGGNSISYLEGTGAGIGSGGIWNDSSSSISEIYGGVVENIVIGNVSELTAKGGSTTNQGTGQGTGAGIGGGGIRSNMGKVVRGADLMNITIKSGTIEAKGGYTSSIMYGSGAGIGGGGVWNKSDTYGATGGNLDKIMIASGTINAKAGYGGTSSSLRGSGAGIGGGGIYNEYNVSNNTPGALNQIIKASLLDSSHIVAATGTGATIYGAGSNIGSGGIRNGSDENVTDGIVQLITNGSVESTPPNVMNVYTNGDKTYYKLTVNDDTCIDSIKDLEGLTEYKDILALGTNGTINVKTIDEPSAIRVYDTSGNYYEVNASNTVINEDTTPPIIESVRYENGNYIIILRDEGAGVWKITDELGTTVLENYE